MDGATPAECWAWAARRSAALSPRPSYFFLRFPRIAEIRRFADVGREIRYTGHGGHVAAGERVARSCAVAASRPGEKDASAAIRRGRREERTSSHTLWVKFSLGWVPPPC
jgi:hypothetical protein